jgi:hypothetical protein
MTISCGVKVYFPFKSILKPWEWSKWHYKKKKKKKKQQKKIKDGLKLSRNAKKWSGRFEQNYL